MPSKSKSVSKKNKNANHSIKHKTSKPLNKSGKNFGNKKNVVKNAVKQTKPKSKNILTKDAIIADISVDVGENKKKFSSRKVLVRDGKKIEKNTKFVKHNNHQNNKNLNSKKPLVKNKKNNIKNNHFKSMFSKVLKFLKK